MDEKNNEAKTLDPWGPIPEQKGERVLTEGEKLVGVSFNPSKLPAVDATKANFARMIDAVLEKRADKSNSYIQNIVLGDTISSLYHACMDVVKCLTFQR